jgi:hypothetical protein
MSRGSGAASGVTSQVAIVFSTAVAAEAAGVRLRPQREDDVARQLRGALGALAGQRDGLAAARAAPQDDMEQLLLAAQEAGRVQHVSAHAHALGAPPRQLGQADAQLHGDRRRLGRAPQPRPPQPGQLAQAGQVGGHLLRGALPAAAAAAGQLRAHAVVGGSAGGVGEDIEGCPGSAELGRGRLLLIRRGLRVLVRVKREREALERLADLGGGREAVSLKE